MAIPELASHLHDVDRVAAVRKAMARLRRVDREVFALCVWGVTD
jgi:RNA polymerase sigma-70 factor (ECF subfamily)